MSSTAVEGTALNTLKINQATYDDIRKAGWGIFPLGGFLPEKQDVDSVVNSAQDIFYVMILAICCAICCASSAIVMGLTGMVM